MAGMCKHRFSLGNFYFQTGYECESVSIQWFLGVGADDAASEVPAISEWELGEWEGRHPKRRLRKLRNYLGSLPLFLPHSLLLGFS